MRGGDEGLGEGWGEGGVITCQLFLLEHIFCIIHPVSNLWVHKVSQFRRGWVFVALYFNICS